MQRPGIAGFSANLLFDPAVVQVNEIKAFDGPTILKAGGGQIPVVYLNYDGRYTPDPLLIRRVRLAMSDSTS